MDYKEQAYKLELRFKYDRMGLLQLDSDLWQHRTIWQEHSAKDFASYESYKRAGILYVFPPFITARMGQKIGRRPQTQLCGDALCKDCSDAGKSIIELLARAEEAEERCKELEERCKRLNEARERANEAAAKWESMYRVALERAEKAEIARKQGNVMVCPVCQGMGRVHTSFYGYGNCLMEDVKNDKFPTVCHACKGKGTIQVNEGKEG